jgi:hypothetical protein
MNLIPVEILYIYRKIFGFHRWESVKCFMWGLAHLDLHRILCQRKFKPYLHLINSEAGFLWDIFSIFSEVNFSYHVGLRLFVRN